MSSFSEEQATEALWRYCPPILFVFGTFGNTMTIIIIRRMKMVRSAMPIYLTALSLSDTCQILTGLLRGWLIHVFQVDVRTLHWAMCKLHTWLVYSSVFTSAWLLGFMTVERTISVWKPHHVSLLCARRKVVVVIVVVVVASLLLNFHLLVWMDVIVEGSENGTTTCWTSSRGYERFFNTAWSWVDLSLSSLIPFAVLLLGNVLIVWKVSVSVQRARTLSSCSNAYQDSTINTRQRKTSSMTVTLMVLSAVFFLTTAPICVYNIAEPYVLESVQGDPRSVARLGLAWAVVNMFMYTNAVLNFYLYCLSGARFRRELKRCLCCWVFSAPTTLLLHHRHPSKNNHEAPSVSNDSQSRVSGTGEEGPYCVAMTNTPFPGIPSPGIPSSHSGRTMKSSGGRNGDSRGGGGGSSSRGRGGGGGSSSSSVGRGKIRGDKKELNRCVLLSLQTCDRMYTSCSDF